MSQDLDIQAKSEALRQQMQAKLGVRSRSLAQAFARAGRRLPRRVRKQGAALAAAEALASNPKLSRQMDMAQVEQDYQAVAAHLATIDVADRRKGRLLSIAGVIAGNLLIVITGFLVWLWWSGHV